MSDPHAVEFLDIAPGLDGDGDIGVGFVEEARPELTSWEQSEVERAWQESLARNPTVFDGPVAAVLGVDRPPAGPLSVRWAPMPYRYRALRRLRPPGRVPGSLYVTVLVPTESGLVVGRGSPDTANPGCWTLPGGAVEPPASDGALDAAELRRQAARELLEETGLRVPSEELRPWALTRGRRFGSLGFHFLCPTTSGELVRRRHAALSPARDGGARAGAAQDGHGTGPELDALAFVASPATAAALGPTADYLPQLLRRYFSSP
ncbi:NUDIX domain-containing protein [Streptomyces sp. NPDC035033]|uniref:NUDIX hydrolase n=1 Tax=Streptomyces sp. NPDC035033 TaxID=3155368 RepID=UPI0033C96CC4